MALKEYQQKRHFDVTPEPKPKKGKAGKALTFVVQKHAARRLHFDFRLEVDGVLKSWAVPNGPSLDPTVKRLAVMVEDHPLDYGSFEGNIPEGEYGAGQVIVWDKGAYSPEEGGQQFFDDRTKAEQIMREGLASGKLKIFLEGERLKGSWALVRMQRAEKNWLLIKHRDEFAREGGDVLAKETSVASGRSLADVKGGKKRASRKVKEKLSAPPVSKTLASDLSRLRAAKKAGFPTSLAPMMATLIKKPFSDPNWIFEPKLDGYRILAFVRKGDVRLISRNGIDVTAQYPLVVEDLSKLPAKETVLDGEMVALDEKGRVSFQFLQNRMRNAPAGSSAAESGHQILYYVFDILYLNGKDLRAVPLMERKKLLEGDFSASDYVRLVEYVEGNGEGLYRAALKNGFEGAIGKRKDSLYAAGRRSANWVKMKGILTDEFIIGGYTRGTGNRAGTMGALLLGVFNEDNKLVFTGHVGTGFNQALLAELKKRLDDIRSEKSPFAGKPPINQPATWVQPKLVAEVKFSERTNEGMLRAPVFLRLREDKPASEVREPEPVPETPPARSKSVGATLKSLPLDLSRPGVAKRAGSSPAPTPSKSLPLSKRGIKGDSEPRDPNLKEILAQLEDAKLDFVLDVGGYQLKITNPDKALWPKKGNQRALTKRDLLLYLAGVSPFMLPHLRDRPLTLTRYPDGITGEKFFQRHWKSAPPEFLQMVALSEHGDVTQDFILCNNLASLLWLGQVANIDFHAWFSRITPEPGLGKSAKSSRDPDFLADYPDFIIFDIDPYLYSGKEAKGAEPELNRKAFDKACQAALWVKEVLDSLKLASFIKTSGRTGLHIHVPIVRQFDYTAVRSAAKMLCGYVFEKHPDDITVDWAVKKRTGKIFLDYNQNVRAKTLAAIYSPRPAPLASVSTPLRWSEVGKIYPTDFTILTLLDRLAKTGDLWADILDKRSDLKSLLGMDGSSKVKS